MMSLESMDPWETFSTFGQKSGDKGSEISLNVMSLFFNLQVPFAGSTHAANPIITLI